MDSALPPPLEEARAAYQDGGAELRCLKPLQTPEVVVLHSFAVVLLVAAAQGATERDPFESPRCEGSLDAVPLVTLGLVFRP